MQDHRQKMRAYGGQLLFDAGALIDRGEEVALHACAVLSDDRLEQAGLSAKPFVERTFRAADPFDNVIDRDLLVAALDKKRCDLCENFALTRFG